VDESEAASKRGSTTADLDPQEKSWIEAAQRGDSRAFERIYRMHSGRVYALCLRLSADPLRAEGFAQDAFVRAWRKLASYSGMGPFGAWLRRLTINVVIEAQRREKRENRWLVPGYEESEMRQGSEIVSTDEGMAAVRVPQTGTEISVDLERAIATLPPGARQVFVLHDVDGWPQKEIAALTGVTLGTIKAQLFRARRLLRGRLRGFGEMDAS
jgi:RNA polymerase sigma-70 factor (ECF subfamily)